MMDAEDIRDLHRQYEQRFGPLPDSRLCSDQKLERIDQLVKDALISGEPITTDFAAPENGETI